MYKDSEDSGFEFGAVCAVSGLQSFNILSIRMLYSIFIFQKVLQLVFYYFRNPLSIAEMEGLY